MQEDVSPAIIQPVTTHPKISQALYPLYINVEWQDAQTENFVIGTTTYSGTSIASVPVLNTMDPGSIFTPFQNYYNQKLKTLDWKTANDLEAGGHTGGQSSYHKNGETILTRFHIDYHAQPENAPSECPCDVTLSLFSAGE